MQWAQSNENIMFMGMKTTTVAKITKSAAIMYINSLHIKWIKCACARISTNSMFIQMFSMGRFYNSMLAHTAANIYSVYAINFRRQWLNR